MAWPPIPTPTDDPPGWAVGNKEAVREAVRDVSSQTSLSAREDEGEAWFEADEDGPLDPVPAATIRASYHETSGGEAGGGWEAGERIAESVVRMREDGPEWLAEQAVEGVVVAMRKAANDAWDKAPIAVEDARRLLNAWALAAPESIGAGPGYVGRVAYERAAAAALDAVVAGTTDGRWESLPQHPLLTLTTRARLSALAQRVRRAYDGSAYAVSVAEAVAHYYAKLGPPRIHEFDVDPEPIDTPGGKSAVAKVIRALAADSAQTVGGGPPGDSHKRVLDGLNRLELLAVVRAVASEDGMLRAAAWMKADLKVREDGVRATGQPAYVKPTWEFVYGVLEALGKALEVRPVFGLDTLQVKYNALHR